MLNKNTINKVKLNYKEISNQIGGKNKIINELNKV